MPIACLCARHSRDDKLLYFETMLLISCRRNTSSLYRLLSTRYHWHCNHHHKTPSIATMTIKTRGCYGNQIFLSPSPKVCGPITRMTRMSSHGTVINCYHGNSTRRHLSSKGSTAGKNDSVKTKDEFSIKKFILSNSEVSRDHQTPEIALRLMMPSCQLWNDPVGQSTGILEDHGIGDPFWAFYWPGGQALTRYLLDNPSVVAGKDVLDVGSGCGASAIAAAMCGAKSVLANDTDRVAIQAIKMNASLNSVTIATTSRNLIGCLDNQWDVVFLGDMFYDRDFTDTVTDWLKYLADHDTDVLIGDPGRIFLQEHPIKELLVNIFKVELSQRCRQENNGMTQGFVWKLCKHQR